MPTIMEKARQILNEKNSQIIPENIKKNVKIFNITGTYEGSGGGGDLSPEDQEALDEINQIVEDFNEENDNIIELSEGTDSDTGETIVSGSFEGYEAGIFKCDASAKIQYIDVDENSYFKITYSMINISNYLEYFENHWRYHNHFFGIIKVYSGNKVIYNSGPIHENDGPMNDHFVISGDPNCEFEYSGSLTDITGIEINFYGDNEPVDQGDT